MIITQQKHCLARLYVVLLMNRYDIIDLMSMQDDRLLLVSIGLSWFFLELYDYFRGFIKSVIEYNDNLKSRKTSKAVAKCFPRLDKTLSHVMKLNIDAGVHCPL